jgi:hypothetical protein
LGSRFSHTSSGASTKISTIRADKRCEGHQSRIAKQLGDGPDAADVLFAILSRETQAETLGKVFSVPLFEHARPGIQAHANVVAIENEAMQANFVQLVVNQVCDGALTASA